MTATALREQQYARCWLTSYQDRLYAHLREAGLSHDRAYARAAGASAPRGRTATRPPLATPRRRRTAADRAAEAELAGYLRLLAALLGEAHAAAAIFRGCHLAAPGAAHFHDAHDFAPATLCGLALHGSGLTEDTSPSQTECPACAAVAASGGHAHPRSI